ncbi:MAG TPA: glycoside hydrolase family 2 TIM barrel-domain containing protein [Tepidisphaeraceae bacterium]|jgi:beta-galactosidase/beta-glucuronidase|nr:glycoside hydrolase family 2 TIM barrel-domain containing protein [Tepidisphaeraceae bacterium]
MKNGKKRAPAPRDHAYPRPQMQREQWISLNGAWDFAIDAADQIDQFEDVKWDRTIQVPFAPETPLSGVGETGLYKAVWYRRQFKTPPREPGQRLLLHFGAVDYEATVWLNGKLAVRHEGGYTPFFADVTDLLNESNPQLLVVRAQDDPEDLAKPRGKQDWQADPHSIWYYRTTGIWQTVWLEIVPETYLSGIRWDPDSRRWEIGLEARLGGRGRHDLSLHVKLSQDNRVLADDNYSFNSDEVARRITIADPGIDDYRNQMLWSPESPKLIDALIELKDAQGNVVDRVTSYTAIRSMALLGDRFVLNGKPYRLYFALDQGYWADGGMTAPDDDAFRRDVELAKAMGFNGVRMHQKIENPRFLYWADRLGLLVWEEMPSAYRFSRQTVRCLTRQWTEAIERDISHPCIMAWVPFNESWGVPDLPDSQAQRNLVQALYHLTKTLDPTRAVIGNDGWEAVSTDVVTIHDYDSDPERLARRYAGSGDSVANLLRDERPGHKLLTLSEFQYANQPIVLSEFGGIAFSRDRSRTWGYSRVENAREFAGMYYRLCSAVRSSTLLGGFCYTQFADTYQEANGLLYMDRTPKFPLEQIAIATRGERSPKDFEVSASWRGAVMGTQRRGGVRRKASVDR